MSKVIFIKGIGMKKLLFITVAIISTAYAEETQNSNNTNCFEFLAGINSGVSTSWYDIPEKDLSASTVVGINEIKLWNTTKIRTTKYFLPFIEAELSGQYLVKNVFFGAGITGGCSIGGKYTTSGYKNYGYNNALIQNFVNNCLSKLPLKIAKQKYHLIIAPYIGYRLNNNNDIYLTGGLKMVSTKYFDKKTKCTLHPMIGFGARCNFKNNIFIKAEYNYVFTKKKQFSDTETLVDGINIYNIKEKIAVKHGESVMRIGVGYKFQW